MPLNRKHKQTVMKFKILCISFQSKRKITKKLTGVGYLTEISQKAFVKYSSKLKRNMCHDVNLFYKLFCCLNLKQLKRENIFKLKTVLHETQEEKNAFLNEIF
jgi:hypothetical protein